MIKLEYCNEHVHIETSGTLLKVTEDVLIVLAHLHASLYSDDPESADVFKVIIKEAISDDPGPVWGLHFLPEIEVKKPTIMGRVMQILQRLKELAKEKK